MWCGQTQTEGKISLHADHPNVQAYEALAAFNRDVDQVLADLERLGALGLLPEREQYRFLKVCRATLEETRAWANFEWTDVLRQKEELDWFRFARIRQREDAR